MARVKFFLLFSIFSQLSTSPLAPPHIHTRHSEPFFGDNTPFIGVESFIQLADWTIDHNTIFFDPVCVKQGDIIYVDSYYLSWFEEQVHDQILAPYLLISRAMDWPVKTAMAKKLIHDPKLVVWFAWNMLFSYHPKLIPIPMGQGVFSWDYEGPKGMLKWIENPPPKKHLLYMNHCPRDFGGRDKLVKLFEDKPFCLSRNRSNEPYKLIHKDQYFEDLTSSYFTLSPIGWAIECMRTWEAIVVGCVPILLHSFQDPLFDELPVLLVHDWSEITQKFLLEKKSLFLQPRTEKAYFKYWEEKILDLKTQVITGNLSTSQPEETLFSTIDLLDLQSILQKPSTLYYQGLLTSARPLQLVRTIPSLSTLYLEDPWAEINHSQIKKGTHIPGTTVFLDLTYFRSSLFQKGNYWEHSLKQDLIDLYEQLAPSTLLCGNMCRDPYVQEVLKRVSQERDLQIESKGNFWTVRKK